MKYIPLPSVQTELTEREREREAEDMPGFRLMSGSGISENKTVNQTHQLSRGDCGSATMKAALFV